MHRLVFFWLLQFYSLFQLSFEQSPTIAPLTNALRFVHCHNLHEDEVLSIRCGANEKIRMLDAFDVVVRNKSNLPSMCVPGSRENLDFDDTFQRADCRIPTSFTSACSGRENCTLYMQRSKVDDDLSLCNNQWIDYTIAFYECISDAFIHDVCSSQSITTVWGTLRTPNFPNPYTSNDDCWCKLSTQRQNRLVLSVIVFQLIPNDQQCASTGLYLQGSDKQRSTQCTYLQQGHHYVTEGNSLFLNFYSRISTVRGGFWITYEANRIDADVHLHCGSREKIGVPWNASPTFSPSAFSSTNQGWNRVTVNRVERTTTPYSVTKLSNIKPVTPSSRSPLKPNTKANRILPQGAFTYPYGSLSTFELAYGPQGWYLKFQSGSSNATVTRFMQTTTTKYPVVKWNSTWLYTRKYRTRVFPFTTKKEEIPASSSLKSTSKKPITTRSSTSTTTLKTSSEIDSNDYSDESVTDINDGENAPKQLLKKPDGRLLIGNGSEDYSKIISFVSDIQNDPESSQSEDSQISAAKTTKSPMASWYPPAAPFDWWQWKNKINKFKQISVEMLSTTMAPYTSTRKITKTTASTTTTSTTTTTTTTTTTISTTTTTASTTTTTTSTATTTKTTTTTSTTTIKLTSSNPTSKKSVSKPTTTTSSKKAKLNSTMTSTTTAVTVSVELTPDWFKWPKKETAETDDDGLEYFEDEYVDTQDSNRSSSIKEENVTSSSSIENTEEIPYLPTRSQWNWNGRILSGNTPIVGRFQTLKSTTESTKKNIITSTFSQNVEERSNTPKAKKITDEIEVLTQTDMTIVIVSILFIVLLAIVNLILFGVRRHRHRLRGRHLLSSSFPSLFNDRTTVVNNNIGSHGGNYDANHSIVNGGHNNNNNNDILPAVGEIVLWDERDQGGYMIDNDGEWSKIQGSQWFGSQCLKAYRKSSFGKSFRSRFRFMRQSEKRIQTRQKCGAPNGNQTIPNSVTNENYLNNSVQIPVNMNQLGSKKNMLMNFGLNSTSVAKKILNDDFDGMSEYQKGSESIIDESNYISVGGNLAGDYSMTEDVVDPGGSVIVTIPTTYRTEEYIGESENGGSIYQRDPSMPSPPAPVVQRNSPSLVESVLPSMKTMFNRSVIVRHCQMDFQGFDPKIICKSSKKSSPIDQNDCDRSSHSFQISTCDSAFVDDSMIDSLTTTSSNVPVEQRENNLNRSESRKVTFQDEKNSAEIGNESPSTFSSNNHQKMSKNSTKLTDAELDDERKRRQVLMNQVLESLKKKRVYFNESNDETTSSIEKNLFDEEKEQVFNQKRMSSTSSDSVTYTKQNLPLNELYTYNSLVETRF